MKVQNNPSKVFLPALVLAVGAYQTYDDYKCAHKKDKKNILIRDILVLSGTGVGAYAGNKFFNQNISENSNLFKKSIKTLINNLSVPVGGIITGFICGLYAEKYFPDSSQNIKTAVNEKVESAIDNNKSSKYFLAKSKNFLGNIDPGTVGKAYSYAGMATGSIFDDAFSTLSGFKVGREKGFKNKIIRASNELISGVIIPVALVVSTASYLKYKNVSNWKKNLIIIPVATAGCFIGNAVGNWFNKKVTEKIVQNELWKDISNKKRELFLSSALGKISIYKFSNNMKKLDEMEKNINTISKDVPLQEKMIQ